jgi:hypothetical protein
MSSRSTPGDTASTRGDAPARSALDRRRDKMQATSRIAVAAAAKVDALDKQLDADTNKRHRHEATLKSALDSVAVQKKALKATTKDRDRHRAARRAARSAAAKARRSAVAAEAKYDRAVLADMVRREKDHDLSAHDDANATTSKKKVAKAPTSRQEVGKGHRRPRSTPAKSARAKSGRRSSATKTVKTSRTTGSASKSAR